MKKIDSIIKDILVEEVYYDGELEAFILKRGLEYNILVERNNGDLEFFGPPCKIFKNRKGVSKIYDKSVEDFLS